MPAPIQNPFQPPEEPPVEHLQYEETPVIEPVVPVSPGTQPIVEPQETPPPSYVPSPVEPPVQPQAQPPTPMPAKKTSPILLIFILVVIFGLGIWASSYVRQFLPGVAPTGQQQTGVMPSPTPSVPPNPYVGWKTYSVISGATHKAIEGVSFQLPPEVADLFCDGPGCASQGTTLPGGTRFTIAARGAGQKLADYRGKIITDFGGKPFVTSATTVSDRSGTAFVGDFTGTTVTGYTFLKMRGAMISVTDTMSLEVNHFTPSTNPSADFASDDVLFTKILDSFVFAGLPTPKATATPTATSSAY